MTGAFDETVLECEQAISHLRNCCPDVEADAVCGDGCNSITLSLAESECIQETSCGAEADAICARIAAANMKAADESETQTQREPVCP